MRLKDVLLKLLGLEQTQGYSLIDALGEEEEALGSCHDDLQIVVQQPVTQKQIPVREPSPSPPLSPASSWSSGLPSDPPSPPRGTAFGRGLIRRNAWPIRPRRIVNTLGDNTLGDGSERIYSARWLRYVIQLARDALANIRIILTMVLLVFQTLIASIVSSYKKITFWVPPAAIFAALTELAMRKYVRA